MGAVARLVEIQKMETAEGAPLLLRRAIYIAEDAYSRGCGLEAADEDDRARAKEILAQLAGLPLPQAGAYRPSQYLNRRAIRLLCVVETKLNAKKLSFKQPSLDDILDGLRRT
jgi:hypothetical protein